MTDQELELLLLDLESDRVERTSADRDRDKIREAICAFANDLPDHRQPGVFFLGVHDDGGCAGLAITDDTLLRLADIRSEGKILPIPSFEVSKRTLAGCTLVALIVHPSSSPPVRLDGRVWVRVGPRRSLATPDEERRLTEKRRAMDLPFDLRAVPGSSVADLDVDRFLREYLPATVHPEVLAENQRSLEEQLRSVRFLDSSRPDATVVGLLICGTSPRTFLPGAYVQFVRFEGSELDSPILDSREVDGTIGDQLRQLEDLMHANLRTASDIRGQVEVKHPDYPLQALRQLCTNALMHRSYEASNSPIHLYWFSDRVEIHSPGGPFGIVTRANFGEPHVTDYRNLHLAEALKNLGYVQRFGIGIALARKALAENGSPPPEFQVESNRVLAVVRARR